MEAHTYYSNSWEIAKTITVIFQASLGYTIFKNRFLLNLAYAR